MHRLFLPLVLLAQTGQADQLITRNDALADWSFFEDRGYCWMASAVELDDGRLLLILDDKGEMSFVLDGASQTALPENADHVLRIGGEDVPFRSRGDWAWPLAEERTHLVEMLFDTDAVGAMLLISGQDETRTLVTQWPTEGGREAFDAMRIPCTGS